MQTLPFAPLNRRLFAACYEFCLLFAVVFISGWLFSTLTQLKDPAGAGAARVWELQAFVALILAIYFSYFWSLGRRTLPQKTWGVRLLRADGRGVPVWLALLRFGLILAQFVGLFGLFSQVFKLNFIFAGAACLLPFFAAYFDSDKQFLHDRLLKTRLVFDDRPLEKS